MISAIIVGAGKGKRLGSKVPKAYILLDKKPLIYYSIKAFQENRLIGEIILVVPEDKVGPTESLINKYRFSKVKSIVAGGFQRRDSVNNGLNALSENSQAVLIHDAARPFISQEVINRVAEALKANKAVVPVIPSKDTAKVVDPNTGYVRCTPDRKTIFFVQTPQGFCREIIPLITESRLAADKVYDESMLVEKKVKVKTVAGDPCNLKITIPQDLKIAANILK